MIRLRFHHPFEYMYAVCASVFWDYDFKESMYCIDKIEHLWYPRKRSVSVSDGGGEVALSILLV